MSITTAEIAQLWRRVNRQMHDLFRSTVEQYDLPPMAYLVLRRIEKEPGVTVSELSRKLGTAKSHASNLVEQLVREGYVEKGTDPADQRVLRLYLSQLAKGRLEQMGDRAQSTWTIVFEEFPEGELEDVARFLSTLLGALERANDRLSAQPTADLATERGVST